MPKTYPKYTSRKVLTTGWIEGEKLSQSTESDVGELVNVGVICYLKQVMCIVIISWKAYTSVYVDAFLSSIYPLMPCRIGLPIGIIWLSATVCFLFYMWLTSVRYFLLWLVSLASFPSNVVVCFFGWFSSCYCLHNTSAVFSHLMLADCTLDPNTHAHIGVWWLGGGEEGRDYRK